MLRLCLLEQELRRTNSARIWMELTDNRICISTNGKRGEEIVFPSVKKCAAFAQIWMREKEVAGVAFISDIATLFVDKKFVSVSDEVLRERGVILNLAERGQESLKIMALSSFCHSVGIAK